MKERKKVSQFFVRNIEAENLLEMFLVSAVASVLVIRFYLQITGYIQLGGDTLHIAHMLWGGILMLAALVLILGFLGHSVQRLAAILGGVGFGVFIDELGKFITSDNDYFFQPTIALIYIIFVLLYLAFRHISQFQGLSKQESLVNALELVKEGVLHRLDEKEKIRLAKLLAHADPAHPVSRAFVSVLKELSADSPKENVYEKGRRFVHDFYMKLVKAPWFLRVVVFIFIGNSLLATLQAILVFWRARDFAFVWDFSGISFLELGELVSSAGAGLLVLAGIIHMRSSRLVAFHYFRYAVLVSIFLTNVLLFFAEELGALLGLGGNIVLLGLLNYMIHEEEGGMHRTNI